MSGFLSAGYAISLHSCLRSVSAFASQWVSGPSPLSDCPSVNADLWVLLCCQLHEGTPRNKNAGLHGVFTVFPVGAINMR